MKRFFNPVWANRLEVLVKTHRLSSGMTFSILFHLTVFGAAMGIIAWGESHAEYKTNIDLNATPLLTVASKTSPPPPETWILAKKSKTPPKPLVTPLPTPETATVVSRQPSLVGGWIDEGDYPMEMRRQKKEGRVIVELLINIEGKVKGVSILAGADPAFDAVVLEKLKDARFQPALDKFGQPMNCRVRLPVNFKLD